MKRLLILCVIIFLFAGCKTLSNRRYETELNIHDIFFAEYEPEDYDDIEKLDYTSFEYGDTPCLVVRFGGLQPEDGIVYWGIGIDILLNEKSIGHIGPEYFNGNLDELTRDKYMARVPLNMVISLQPGLYKFIVYIMDGITYDMVETSIEFSLLPRTI